MWVGSSWRVDGHLSVSRAIGEYYFVHVYVLKCSDWIENTIMLLSSQIKLTD